MVDMTRLSPPALAPSVGSPRRGLVLATMCAGMFLVQLDVTVVNVALPRIRADLGASLAGQQWVVDAYAIALAGLLLIGGAAGDRYGHKRVVLTGMAVFAAASLLCAVAPGVGVLVSARAVQGIGAALLLPGTLAVITRTYSGRAEQARAVGVWAGASALALPAGPVLGGALVTVLGWRSVFWLNVPIIVVAGGAVALLVRDERDGSVGRLDVIGAVCAAVALASAVYAVIMLGAHGPGTAAGIAVALTGAALVALAARERRAAQPLLPPALLRTPGFGGANLVAAAMNFVGIGTVFAATLYLQTVQVRSALLAGVLLLPLFVPLAALAPVTGRVVGRVGPRAPMCGGLLLGVAGSAALIGVSPSSSYLRFLPVLLGLGVGMGFLASAVVAAAMRAAGSDRAGLASGVNNTARQAAGALGIAVYGSVIGNPDDPPGFTAGLQTMGVIAAAIWAAALVITVVMIPSAVRRR